MGNWCYFTLLRAYKVSMEVIVTIVSKLVYNLLTGRIQPTYIGVITHLLSSMDIPVGVIIPFITGHLVGRSGFLYIWSFSPRKMMKLNSEQRLESELFSRVEFYGFPS